MGNISPAQQKIKDTLVTKGITLGTLGEATGLEAYELLTTTKGGKSNLSIDDCIKIGAYLGINPTWLFTNQVAEVLNAINMKNMILSNMKASGLTIEMVSTKTGLSEHTLISWLGNHENAQEMDFDVCAIIARGTGINASYIYSSQFIK